MSEQVTGASSGTGRGALGRLNKEFVISIRTTLDGGSMHLSGPITTEDELDALMTILGVLRAWLTPAKPQPESPNNG